MEQQTYLKNPLTGAVFISTPELLARGDLVPVAGPSADEVPPQEPPPQEPPPAAVQATRPRKSKAQAKSDEPPALPVEPAPVDPEDFAATVEAVLNAAE